MHTQTYREHKEDEKREKLANLSERGFIHMKMWTSISGNTLKGHELGQTSGDGEGQGGLVCCSP